MLPWLGGSVGVVDGASEIDGTAGGSGGGGALAASAGASCDCCLRRGSSFAASLQGSGCSASSGGDTGVSEGFTEASATCPSFHSPQLGESWLGDCCHASFFSATAIALATAACRFAGAGGAGGLGMARGVLLLRDPSPADEACPQEDQPESESAFCGVDQDCPDQLC